MDPSAIVMGKSRETLIITNTFLAEHPSDQEAHLSQTEENRQDLLEDTYVIK
jgi:hypothetical protein